jgi:hypothetical protein
MARPFYESVLVRAAGIQGERPPGMIPDGSEIILGSAFAGTPLAQYATNRDTLLKALTDLEDKGWMQLIKVSGPWAWQVTNAGLDRAAQIKKEEERAQQNREKELRQALLGAFEAKWRANPTA